MSKKSHNPSLPQWLNEYTKDKPIRFEKYSSYHMRLMDEGFVCLDIWTTGKYYVKETNYYLMQPGIVERGTEKGQIPADKAKLFKWLNQMFFPLDMV